MRCAAHRWLHNLSNPRTIRAVELLSHEFDDNCRDCARAELVPEEGDWGFSDGVRRSSTVRRLASHRDAAQLGCSYCYRLGTSEFDPDGCSWHWDHRLPLSRGGDDELDNLAKCCRRCNLRKHNKTDREFLEVLR